MEDKRTTGKPSMSMIDDLMEGLMQKWRGGEKTERNGRIGCRGPANMKRTDYDEDGTNNA